VRYVALAVVALSELVLDANAGQTARKPKTHTVVIEGTTFAPASLTIASGDSVVWLNKDPFPHTATSKAGGFDSQVIAAGESWKYVARKKGDFAYICTLHTTMKGVLRVK
jgi:plastocyanin